MKAKLRNGMIVTGRLAEVLVSRKAAILVVETNENVEVKSTIISEPIKVQNPIVIEKKHKGRPSKRK